MDLGSTVLITSCSHSGPPQVPMLTWLIDATAVRAQGNDCDQFVLLDVSIRLAGCDLHLFAPSSTFVDSSWMHFIHT